LIKLALNGRTPWKALLARFKCVRYFILEMNLGMVPFSWFPLRSKCVSSGMDEIESGIGPDSLFEDKDRFFKEIRSPIESGMSPEMVFLDKFRDFRFESRVMEVGIEPLSRLSDKSMNVRFEWNDLGMFPERFACEIVKETISCIFPRITKRPEVETGTEETVRSVRLTRRAKKTPERPLRRRRKEETAVKEWSESGRRGGGESEGQLRKEREVRDGERALRAVVEMERSVEQFVKEMEVTRRNGELVSQVTTEEEVDLVVGRWLQGSLTVGMLRDSRALSCFGSNGEEDEEGL
jgi:hypothetical protein